MWVAGWVAGIVPGTNSDNGASELAGLPTGTKLSRMQKDNMIKLLSFCLICNICFKCVF